MSEVQFNTLFIMWCTICRGKRSWLII